MQTIAANLGQLAFDYLDAPPVVVGSRNWITPAAEMEEAFFPQTEWILDAIHERVVPLPGHKPTTNQTRQVRGGRSLTQATARFGSKPSRN